MSGVDNDCKVFMQKVLVLQSERKADISLYLYAARCVNHGISVVTTRRFWYEGVSNMI